MKQKKLFLIVSILILLIINIIFSVILILKNDLRNKEQNEIIESWIRESESISQEEINEELSEDAIGKLKIPIIDVDAEIAEGTDQVTLSKYIGHFSNSSIWNGNVVLASHNRGNNVVHYFEKINQLKPGDLIIYMTRWGNRQYKVESIEKIKETDWSITEDSDKNMLTLITCIKGQKEKRLCVKAIEF